MALVMTPIYTQTVGAGLAVNVIFNNIPQVFTDLLLKISVRSDGTTGNREIGLYFSGTGFPAPSTFTILNGNGSATSSQRNGNFISLGVINDASTTANTFSSHEVYIPNYTSTNFKQVVIDAVSEHNGALANQRSNAALNRQTAAITSITMDSGGELYQQHSTFSLYGIIRSGA